MGKQFFCVRGYMKSGTNWLGSLLSSHQHVDCVGEFHWQTVVQPFNKALNTLPVYQNPEYPDLAQATRASLENMIREALTARADPNAKFIGDRTPQPIEPVVLRGAPHICIVRDGRDVLVSRAFHLYNRPQTHRFFERFPKLARTLEAFQKDPWFFSKNPDQLLGHQVFVKESARWWREHLEQDRKTLERLPRLPVKFVRYEDLHQNVEAKRAELFEFLGVDPKKAAKIQGHLKPGFEEERPDEFLRKGEVGDWTNYFTDKVKQWFKDASGDELTHQGYVDDDSW